MSNPSIKTVIAHIDCSVCAAIANVFENPRGKKLYVRCPDCEATIQGAGDKAQAAIRSDMWIGSKPVGDPVQLDEGPLLLGVVEEEPEPVIPDKKPDKQTGSIGWKAGAVALFSLLLIGIGLKVKL